jgi:hypothetical protein
MVSLFFTKKWSFLILLEVLGGCCDSCNDYGSSDNNYDDDGNSNGRHHPHNYIFFQFEFYPFVLLKGMWCFEMFCP